MQNAGQLPLRLGRWRRVDRLLLRLRAATRQPDPAGLSIRLHVSNLPFRYAELARFFATYGLVIDAEVIFNEKGSKSFGFITLGTAWEKAWARQQLHGAIVEGLKVEVNPATAKVTPRAPTLASQPHGGGAGAGGGPLDWSKTITFRLNRSTSTPDPPPRCWSQGRPSWSGPSACSLS